MEIDGELANEINIPMVPSDEMRPDGVPVPVPVNDVKLLNNSEGIKVVSMILFDQVVKKMHLFDFEELIIQPDKRLSLSPSVLPRIDSDQRYAFIDLTGYNKLMDRLFIHLAMRYHLILYGEQSQEIKGALSAPSVPGKPRKIKEMMVSKGSKDDWGKVSFVIATSYNVLIWAITFEIPVVFFTNNLDEILFVQRAGLENCSYLMSSPKYDEIKETTQYVYNFQEDVKKSIKLFKVRCESIFRGISSVKPIQKILEGSGKSGLVMIGGNHPEASWTPVEGYLQTWGSNTGIPFELYMDRFIKMDSMPYRQPWLGIYHTIRPDQIKSFIGAGHIIGSLQLCLGIMVFSRNSAIQLKRELNNMGLNIPIKILNYPVREGSVFDIELFKKNPCISSKEIWLNKSVTGFDIPEGYHVVGDPESEPDDSDVESSDDQIPIHLSTSESEWSDSKSGFNKELIQTINRSSGSDDPSENPEDDLDLEVVGIDPVDPADDSEGDPEDDLSPSKSPDPLSFSRRPEIHKDILNVIRLEDPDEEPPHGMEVSLSENRIIPQAMPGRDVDISGLYEGRSSVQACNGILILDLEGDNMNVIVESICSRTPFLIRRPSWDSKITELLGGYPLFFDKIEEIPDHLQTEKVVSAYEFLCKIQESKFSLERFLTGIKESSIYRSISFV